MAYCLRDLQPDAQSLIDEMGQHWRDLERLKAAGGTPSARIMKGLRVGRADDGSMVFVVKNQDKDHIRSVVCNTKNRCWMCDLGFVRDDFTNLVCNSRGNGREPWFMVLSVGHRVHNMMTSRRWRAARDAARE